MFRSGSGAPGPAYYQQQADYKMNIELDDVNAKITIKLSFNYPLRFFYESALLIKGLKK